MGAECIGIASRLTSPSRMTKKDLYDNLTEQLRWDASIDPSFYVDSPNCLTEDIMKNLQLHTLEIVISYISQYQKGIWDIRDKENGLWGFKLRELKVTLNNKED